MEVQLAQAHKDGKQGSLSLGSEVPSFPEANSVGFNF